MSEVESITRQLDEVISQLRRLNAAMAPVGSAKAKVLRPADRTLLAAILPAISDATAGAGFCLADLREVAEIHEQLSASLADHFGPHTPEASKRLGRLLGRAEGMDVGPFRVERVGEFREGAFRRVVRLDDGAG